GLNGSGRSPKGLTLAMVRAVVQKRAKDGQIALYGALPVSVPGAVDGWFPLHERFGKLEMEQILSPAIRYAREGFPVTQVIAYDWQRNVEDLEANADLIEELDNFRKLYAIDGRAPREGEIFRNPDLAATYERIAAGGRDAFYEGEIADVIDGYMQRIGGWIRKEDLAGHHSEWVEPVS